MPATAQFGDEARIIVSSTPYGSDGVFADLYGRSALGGLADAVAHHATSAEANPTLLPGFLEMERARDPESFKSEYLAEFVGSGHAYSTRGRLRMRLRIVVSFTRIRVAVGGIHAQLGPGTRHS